MANSKQLEILKTDVDSWNQWRSENGQVIPDLSGAVLDRMNLTLVNFADANLAGASLLLANLEGADLRWANLAGANLVGARLIGVDFVEANIRGADLRTAEDLTQEQINETLGDAATGLPEGLIRPANWTK